MATLKFIIRKNKASLNKDGSSLIFLRYTHRGKTSYFSTGKSVIPEDWNQTSQQIKRSYKGHSSSNMFLSKFRQRIEEYVNKALYEGIEPTSDYIRSKYDSKKSKRQQDSTKQLSFEEFSDKFIEESKKTKKAPTIKSYDDFMRILKMYKKSRKRRKLIWSDFDMEFYYDFMEFYIEERGASNNTFGKMIKTLKTFLNAGVEQGYNKSLTFRDKRFKVYQEEVSNIYLNEDELKRLLSIDYENNLKRRTIRDLFVIGCYTGLRFGDFKQINEKNISNNRLRVKTQKTGKYVVIPLHPIVKDIILQYNGALPTSYCNSVVNAELKHIGQDAGLDEIIVKVRTHGINRKEKSFLKWELLSTHCARRSFATNLFKQGFPAISIMKITGHKSEKTFMRYIKVTEDEIANMLEDHWQTIS